MNDLSPTVLERLKSIVGPRGFIDDQADMRPYLVEWRDKWFGRTPVVLRPDSVEQVQAILKLCNETRTPVVPQGGNTGLVGGGIPFEKGEEIVLSLNRMNRIRAVDPLDDTMTVEAGVILQKAQEAADAVDRLFPMRIASEGTCQIGGNLSTNAGGTAVLRYGNMRDLVLGLEVVLPDGQLWDGLRALRKDNTGYDLKHLFIGAEGTLGVITAAVLKLYPKPADRQVSLVALPDVRASVELLALAKSASGGQVTGFELMPLIGMDLVAQMRPEMRRPIEGRHPWYALIEMSSSESGGALRAAMERTLEDGFEKGFVIDAALAESEAHARELWSLRELLSEAQKLGGGSIKHDISVRPTLMPDFIAAADKALEDIVPGFRSLAFGHIGDGNIHYNPLQPAGGDKQAFLDQWERVATVVHDIAHSMGGSISAEHGLGRLKHDEILRYKSALEMDLMRRVKAALDPNGIMNPGKVVTA